MHINTEIISWNSLVDRTMDRIVISVLKKVIIRIKQNLKLYNYYNLYKSSGIIVLWTVVDLLSFSRT